MGLKPGQVSLHQTLNKININLTFYPTYIGGKLIFYLHEKIGRILNIS